MPCRQPLGDGGAGSVEWVAGHRGVQAAFRLKFLYPLGPDHQGEDRDHRQAFPIYGGDGGGNSSPKAEEQIAAHTRRFRQAARGMAKTHLSMATTRDLAAPTGFTVPVREIQRRRRLPLYPLLGTMSTMPGLSAARPSTSTRDENGQIVGFHKGWKK